MLIIVSDLHFTDGTSGETIREGAFRVFRGRLLDAAYDASWRSDGKYRPVETVDLVLLGDVFDVIRSARWLDGAVRPWADPQSNEFVETVTHITQGILDHNCRSLAVFKSLVQGDAFTIPPADADGKPAPVSRAPEAPERTRVSLRIHYLVGNHDWFYHLPGTPYHEIRRKIKEAIGLTNPAEAPFPHDPQESPQLLSCFEEHRVFARHGDVYDGFNFEGDRNASSLGDAIVIELLNRFPGEVERQLGDDLPLECRQGLKEIDNVRPLLLVPMWVAGLLRRTCPDADLARKVRAVWDQCADRFLDLDFVRRRDRWQTPLDRVDQLQMMLRFSTGVSPEAAGRMLYLIDKWCPSRRDSYRRYAMAEAAFKNRKARFLVYGHTHCHEIVPVDVYVGDKAVSQVYLNSGTWRQVHELAQLRPWDQEFVGYKVLTYLVFYREDERGGRTFEAWSGALGE
jgi:hypothetical protein